MKKIIKIGTRKITTCVNCGCKFSYEEEDVINDIRTLNDFTKFVECPQCESKVAIKQTK